MNEMNKPLCGQSCANTGSPECDFVPGRQVGIILVRKSKVFTGVELEDFLGTLKKLAQAAKSERIYPVFRFGTLNDSSVEPTEASLGIGYGRYVNDGSYKLIYPLVNGSAYYVEQLRKFNGDKYAVLIVHDNGITGTRTDDGGVRGFTLSQFYVHKPKMGDDSNPTTYNVEISLPKPTEFVDRLAFLATDKDVEYEVKGIRDYRTIQKNATASALSIDIVDACTKESIIDVYGTELADKAIWTASGGDITAVTLSGTVLSFTGTFADGDMLICADTATLAEKGIGGSPEYGLEIGPLTIKVA